MTKDDLEQASVLAQQLLEAGLAFGTRRRSPIFGGKLRKNQWRAEYPVQVYDPEQIKELRLKPTDLIREQVIAMLLAKHEQHQANRAKGKRPSTVFYESRAWRNLRYRILSERGAKCECCGATAKDGKTMHVDHIKPRSVYPELALDPKNLQVLCNECNMGKSNVLEDDWRKHKRVLVKQENKTG